jgi:NAD(P)-dependent dehydrogenase (short-subunit alcohol dehydrogenase family)
MQMQNKVAVVTGAARGNGFAMAKRLAAEGAHVVMGDVREEELAKAAKAIRDAGGKAEAVRCDVSNPDDVEALVAAAERLGGPHAVVAQAGVQFSELVEDTTPEDWDRVMSVDAKGVFLAARAAIPRMKKLGGGSIVTMSGTYAWFAEPAAGAHCAAKGAVFALTKCIALEVAPWGIRCNTIAPGAVDTPMYDEFLAAAPDPKAAYEQLAVKHPLGRFAKMDEVAALTLFLCSDESVYITGACFTIDGGLTAGFSAVDRETFDPIVTEGMPQGC